MPLSTHNTSLYTLGKGIMYIGLWTGTTPPTYPGDYTDVGNCPSLEVEVTEEVLDHYSSRSGTRTKDKQVTLETGYTITFDLDEVSIFNLKMFLKATQTGTTKLHANQALDQEYGVRFITDNPAGPNEVWEFWRVRLTPNGAFNLISDEWSTMSFTGEGLADSTNHATSPYFDVTWSTTTTTSTSTSTTTTTAAP